MIRDALQTDLPAIVAIYNAAIPGRLASADTDLVTVGSRQPWFIEHSPAQYPLWVLEQDSQVLAWLSLSPFYGRPAYAKTAELSVYVSSEFRHRGLGTALLQEAIRRGPSIGKDTFLAFVFGHNIPSIRLFEKVGFTQWGNLPQVAVLDAVKRDLVILGLHLP